MGNPLTDLRTPAVLIDRNKALRNIQRMQDAASQRGIRLRPHAKTHKSPEIARWQIERGAVGICCAKIGEAEVFADAGIADIRIPYPINPSNADRVVALSRKTRLSFIVDHPVVARQWSHALSSAGASIDVLVKIDVGFHRCGINPDGDAAVAMIRDVAALPGFHFCGLLSHAGHAYHAHLEDEMRQMAEAEAQTMRHLVARCRAAGVTVEEVSAGATPPARYSLQQDGFTEYRPGNYVYFDRTQVSLGAATKDDCALTVLTTVVSKPAPDRIILDAGSKTLTSDGARGFTPAPGMGEVIGHPNLLVERLSEEHATVRVTDGTTALEPGDRVLVLPNHSCPVSNLAERVWIVSGDHAEALVVAARGRCG